MHRCLVVVALIAAIPALALPLLAGIAVFCLPAAIIAGIASLSAPVQTDARDHSAVHRALRYDIDRPTVAGHSGALPDRDGPA